MIKSVSFLGLRFKTENVLTDSIVFRFDTEWESSSAYEKSYFVLERVLLTSMATFVKSNKLMKCFKTFCCYRVIGLISLRNLRRSSSQEELNLEKEK